MSPRSPLQDAARRVIALLLALATAGCVGGAPDTSPNSLDADAETSGAPGPDEAVPLAPARSVAAHEAIWANGTFKVQEHRKPKGLVFGAAGLPPDWERQVDITDRVPRAQPVRIAAVVRAPLAQGDLDLWLDVGGNEFWTGQWDTPYGGFSRFEVVIVRTTEDPIRVVLQYDDVEASPEFAYALFIRLDSDPDRLPVGVPHGLTLPGGAARIEVAYEARPPLDGDARPEPFLIVWDPQDEFVGRFPFGEGNARVDLPTHAPAGEYVLLASQGLGDVRVRTNLTDATVALRLLGGEVQLNQRQLGPAEKEASWTFEAQRWPLLAGFFVGANTLSVDFQGSLEGPRGRLVGGSFTGGPWLYSGWGFDSGFGHERLAPGTYRASFAFGQSAGPDGVSVGDFVVYYRR